VLEAIEEAQRAHLVTPVTAGRDPQFAFEHELIRQTLAEGLSIPRRQRLHGRIALAIETLYASNLTKHVSILAHHLYQAGAAADLDRTLHYLVEASDQARVAAGHEEALGHLDRACGMMEGDRSERMADLADRRASVLASLGQTREAAEIRKQAAAIWRNALTMSDTPRACSRPVTCSGG